MLRTAIMTMLGVLAISGCGDDSGAGSMAGMGAVGTGGMAGGGTGGMAGGGTGGTGGAGTGGMTSDAPIEPKFSAIYEKVLPSCGGPFCHTGSGGGNLVMDTQANAYKNLVGVAAMGMNLPNATNPMNCKDSGLTRVVAGDPEMSLLYSKVRLDKDVPCGSRMPTGGMLKQAQVDAIKAWIMAGAKDD